MSELRAALPMNGWLLASSATTDGTQIQAVFARDHDGRLPLHEGHQRVGGAEVDADDVFSSHCVQLLSQFSSAAFTSLTRFRM